MDEVKKAAKTLRNAIDQTETAKEYRRLKELFENDEELRTMREEIARLAEEGKLEEKQNLLEIYEANPLVSNYYALREEMTSLLNEIREVLGN